MTAGAAPSEALGERRTELVHLLFGFVVTQAIAATARLGVPDALADGPRPVAELAAAVGADEDALRRFLRALAPLGVYEQFDDGCFGNTPLSELLRAEAHGSAGWLAECFRTDHYRVWSHAEESLRTGRSAAPTALGADYFDWLAENPEAASTFNRAMAGGASVRAEAVVNRAWGDELVVDVGGGTGRLLTSLLERQPGLRGIVFDLPHSEADAVRAFEASGIEDRASFVAGDFFESVPAGDVYVLAQILHDWDDDAGQRILRNCREAGGEGCSVLVVDLVVPEAAGGAFSKLLDLHMLVLLGGRERTEAEWRTLFTAGGFDLVEVKRGPLAVLEGRAV